ncbi:MAG: Dabb family protein [Rikenellaceae bacterium]
MIKHVVMWKFLEEAEGNTKSENLKIFKEGLEALVPIIPELKSLEVGLDILGANGSYDMILITTFDSMADLVTYNNHPEHQKVAGFCAKVRESRVAVDFSF